MSRTTDGATRARRMGCRAAIVLGSLLLTTLAWAQDSSAAHPASGLDRLIFALGLLVVLSQATERLMVLLRKLLSRLGVAWAQPSTPTDRQDPKVAGDRAALLNAYSVVVGLIVAFASGVNVVDVLKTGQLTVTPGWPWQLAHDARLGLILTGLIASMGSAFLSDLLAVVKAVKDTKREVAEGGRMGGVTTATGAALSGPTTGGVS